MAVSTGVTNGFPVKSFVPPVAVLYQLTTTPGTSVTDRDTVPFPQEKNTGAEGTGAVGMVTRVIVAVPEDEPEQLLLEVEMSV